MAFNMTDFLEGSKQAFVIVTRKLYDGDYDGLQGLISEEALSRLRDAIEKLTTEQRQVFDLKISDIYGHFFLAANFSKATTGNDFFEILIAFHCFRDMEQFRKDVPKADSVAKLLEYKDRFVLANLRFAKMVTPSVDPDWTVIYANYGGVASVKGVKI